VTVSVTVRVRLEVIVTVRVTIKVTVRVRLEVIVTVRVM
jgi:hypothetical protein